MALIVKKEPNGQILAKVSGDPNLLLIKKVNKFVDGWKVNVAFFVNPQLKQCFWVLDRIQTNVLSWSDIVKNGQVGLSSSTTTHKRINVKVRWDQPVIFYLHNWDNDQRPQMMDADLNYLSCSNTYGDHSRDEGSAHTLCMGNAFDHLSVDLVDIVFYGKANGDLGWVGGNLHGSSKFTKDATDKRFKIFEVTQWTPIRKSRHQLPPEIIAYANALRK